MARVEGKDGLLVRLSNWYTRRSYGREITITPVIAHTPLNMIGWGTFEFCHEHSHKVDERLKTLAAIKVATKVGCEFCIDIGTWFGRKFGITEEQIRDFHNWRESDAFSVLDKLVIEYAEEVSEAQVEVSDELFTRLREHFDDAQLVELTAAIAIENFRARFNNALGIGPAGFSEGAVCPLPEKRQEAVEAGRSAA
jgi:4-carboxymuconolactone decarboxylase